MTNAIDIQSVSKSYGKAWKRAEVKALRDIAFSVAEGEVFGFVGPNGAGKSTAIKILVGGITDFLGKAEIFGLTVRDPNARRGVAYVPENPSLYEYLTPLELLQHGRKLHNLPNATSVADCMVWLDRLGVGSVAGRQVRTFSKGMLQRTTLALALACQPRLLILDEPLSGLDPIGRKEVVEVLAEYKNEGGTLLFTSHVLHDVERLADRFCVIHQGQIKAIQSPSDMLADDQLVVIRSTGEMPVPGMQKESESAQRWVCEVPRAVIWQLLRLLEQSGHQVIEIRPSLSLEQVFFKVLAADR